MVLVVFSAYRQSVCLLIVFIFFTGSVTGQNTTGVLICKFCNRVPSLDGCTGSVKCSDDESCFMDEILTAHNTTVYSGGCQAKLVCSAGISGSTLVGRREMTRRESGDLISCSMCCDRGRDCNAGLCSIKYQNTNRSRCYLCDSTVADSQQRDVNHPEDCLSETTCQPNEVCFVERFVVGLRYTFRYGCMQTKICSLITQQALLHKDVCTPDPDPILCGNRKRQAVKQCTACCGDGLCNSGTCEDVVDQLYKLWKWGAIDLLTLKQRIFPTPSTHVTTTRQPTTVKGSV